MVRIKKSDEGKAWARRRMSRGRPATVEIRKRILIVSEDEKSSCFYFRKYAEKFLPGYVSVCVCGKGMSTRSLVEEVPRVEREQLELLRKSGVVNPRFDEAWVVFDLDDFKDEDFDNAILMAETMPHCHAAWSNECFEYWYLLHFNKYASGMKRSEIYEKLESLIPAFHERFPNTHYEDLKGEAGRVVHEEFAVKECERVQAVRWAAAQDEYWSGGNEAPHDRNPSTRVYRLILSLEQTRSIGALRTEDDACGELTDGR